MIDFNEGHIVQMSFSEKIKLKGMIEEALRYRQQLNEN